MIQVIWVKKQTSDLFLDLVSGFRKSSSWQETLWLLYKCRYECKSPQMVSIVENPANLKHFPVPPLPTTERRASGSLCSMPWCSYWRWWQDSGVCVCVVCWSFVSLLDGVTAASAAWGDLPRGHRELEGAHSRGTGSWRGSPWWEQGWGFTGQRAPSAAGPSGDHLMWWNEACIRPTAALLTK